MSTSHDRTAAIDADQPPPTPTEPVTTEAAPTEPAPRERRRVVAWRPGADTGVAAATLVAFWLCYWGGTTLSPWILWLGIIVFGTAIPAWTVLRWRREGLAGLGIRRRWLVTSLVVSLVLGGGSAYELVTSAAELGVPLAPHLIANVLVLWEPLFVFGWLYLRWERAFGWLPAILLTGIGFTLQHIGAVPVAAAISFGVFAIAFAIVFTFVRNLVVLWPLFYPVASGIGTLQAGFAMGWDSVVSGAVLLVVQIVVLAGIWLTRARSARTNAVSGAGQPAD